jgi:hypothetical protein
MLWYAYDILFLFSLVFDCHISNQLTCCIGRVYCHSCSSKYIHLPEKMNVYQGYSSVYTRAKSWVYWTETTKVASEPQRVCFISQLHSSKLLILATRLYFSFSISAPIFNIFSKISKVCESCYDAVAEQEELWIYIQAFQVIALELPLLKRAATGKSQTVYFMNSYIYNHTLIKFLQIPKVK